LAYRANTPAMRPVAIVATTSAGPRNSCNLVCFVCCAWSLMVMALVKSGAVRRSIASKLISMSLRLAGCMCATQRIRTQLVRS
jgi:hypothetical protein